jgi:hypothetical protein
MKAPSKYLGEYIRRPHFGANLPRKTSLQSDEKSGCALASKAFF